MSAELLTIAPGLDLPLSELRYLTSRSSGPGGQNVNKVETRVTLLFDLEGSPSLDDEQKGRIRERLSTRVNKAGVLRVVAQKHRTQSANRQTVTERFARLLAEALERTPERKATRPSASAKRRRLEEKRRRARLKRDRRTGRDWE